MKTQIKALYLENFLLIALAPDDKGELIKAGHYVLLRRATLLSQPENEKVYSLGDYVVVRSETNDWFMCVISEINDPLKEVKRSGLSGNLGSTSC